MLSKASEVETLIKKVVEKFGRVDIAFNNAGIEGAWVPIVRQSEEDWDRIIAINLKGVWLCLKYEIRQMLKQGAGGAIVNMASVNRTGRFCGGSSVQCEQTWSDRLDEDRRAGKC